MISVLLFFAVGFASGSVPFSYLAARRYTGKDIRNEGSGNVGATNVFRVAGRSAGVLAVIGDVLKSLVPVLAARLTGAPLESQLAAAAGVVAGHCYSPWLGFKGGKGVLSTVAVVAVLCLPAAAGFGVVWLATFLASGYVSLASIAGAAAVPAVMVAAGARPAARWFGLALFLFVVWKHRANIGRLAAGTESRMRGPKARS